MKNKSLQTFITHHISILLTVCALLGLSSMVYADTNKIHGNFSGSWDDYDLDGNGEVEIDITVGNYEFGIKYNNNNTWYSADHTFSNTQTDYDFDNYSGIPNAKLNTTIAGKYKFKVKDNKGKPRLDLTFPSSGSVDYYVAGDGWCGATNWCATCDDSKMSINSSDPDYSTIPSITFSNVASGDHLFKVATYSWESSVDCNGTFSNNLASGDTKDCDGYNIKLSLSDERDVTIAYNGSTVYIRTVASCTAPTASNFAVSSGATPTYDGSSHQADVVGSVGSPSTYNPTNVVCYYGANSSSTATSQTNAGTYNIYVHSADASGGYCAVTSTITTELATQLVISPVTPADGNKGDLFDVSGTGTYDYDNSSHSATVTWKEAYENCGTITVKYFNSSNVQINTAPVDVDVYTVKISVASGDNNNASESDITVGTITITAKSPGLALGDISNKCGTGDYALSSTSNSAGAVTYSVTSGNATIVNGTTLRVNATGDVTVQASQVADGNYTAQVVSRTYSFAAAPVAGFSASADAETLEFSNIEYVPTTLRTDANSEWDFRWICDSHPTWGTNNTPTIVSSTSNSTEVRFPIEGVYTFHVNAKCKKDESYVSSSTVTVTVSLPLCIKGPLTNSDGETWNTPVLISNISNNNTRTYEFTAYCKSGAGYERQFVLNASSSTNDDYHHIHTNYTYLTLENIENSGHNNNLRATTALGITNEGTPVVLTITHNGGLYYNLSLALDCSTPETKTISISDPSVCEGASANVIVASSQNGYIYTVYDSNSSVAGSGTGTGSNLNISVTPSAGTTYTVKAKQADACLETSMANTVDISVNERPSFTPSTGITQYAPVTVTSTALSPSWSIASKDPDVDAAWISTTSGSSTVLKAPTGTYTVSDGGPCPTNAIVVSNDTEICN